VTDLLLAWAQGDTSVSDRLFETVYPEIRRIAHQYLSSGAPGAALQTTELAHETYLRLAGQRPVRWRNRAHFFALFATHLRRVLIDLVRHGNRRKRGGGAIRINLDHLDLPVDPPRVDLLDLDQALTRLAQIAPTAALVVELRFFTGLSLDETADALDLGRTTVKRKWRFSRAWLARALTTEALNAG